MKTFRRDISPVGTLSIEKYYHLHLQIYPESARCPPFSSLCPLSPSWTISTAPSLVSLLRSGPQSLFSTCNHRALLTQFRSRSSPAQSPQWLHLTQGKVCKSPALGPSPLRPAPVTILPHLPLLNSLLTQLQHRGFRTVPQTQWTRAYLRVFVLAVPSTWDILLPMPT